MKISIKTKLLFYLLSSIIIVGGITISYIAVKWRENRIENAKNHLKSLNQIRANTIKLIISKDVNKAIAFAKSLQIYNNIDYTNRLKILKNINVNIEKDSNYYNVWPSYELK